MRYEPAGYEWAVIRSMLPNKRRPGGTAAFFAA